MNTKEAFAQGARCGHIEGNSRAGMYVLNEELFISYEAADNQHLGSVALANVWALGYRFGYKRAAEGSELPKEYAL